MKNIHSEEDLEIRNCISNCTVLEALRGSNTFVKKCFSLKKESTDKILSMWWNTGKDLRSHNEDLILNSTEVPTKRQILNIVVRVFDPLGLLSMFFGTRGNSFS